MNNLINIKNAFLNLSEEVRIAFLTSATQETIKKNDYFTKEGQVCHHLCYILKGLCKGFVRKEDKEIVTFFCQDDTVVTSLSSFITQRPSKDNIQMIEDTVILKISREKLYDLYNKYPEMANFGRMTAENYFLVQAQRSEWLQFLTAKQRYEQWLKDNPELLHRVSLNDLASFIGITRESLSRIRAMRDKKILKANYKDTRKSGELMIGYTQNLSFY